MNGTAWQPRIAAFICNACAYRNGNATRLPIELQEGNILGLHLGCSGSLDPQFVIRALAIGADAVLVVGCHPDDCPHAEGNYRMLRRLNVVRRLLEQVGVPQERVRLEWIGSGDRQRIPKAVAEVVEAVRRLGPLKADGSATTWERRMQQLGEAMGAQDIFQPAVPLAESLAGSLG